MEINLTGKTALVTGGNTGIGRGISLTLARAGADVALTYYSHPEQGEETAQEIRALGRKAIVLRLDATDSAQVNAVLKQAAEGLGGHIDILVNNAGHLVGRVPIAEMSDEHWRRVIGVNLDSMFYCARGVLPYMNTGWGRIISVSSVAAHDGGGPGAAAYSAAKAGMIALTRGLAKEYAKHGITVNAVAPGLILGTAFHEQFSTPEGIKTRIGTIPLARAGMPEDVAGVVLFYASDLSAYVTGDCAEINGGSWFA